MAKFIYSSFRRGGKSPEHLFTRFGGMMRCTVCGHEQALSVELVDMYFASGWPTHCGYTMRWITQRELDGENGEGA